MQRTFLPRTLVVLACLAGLAACAPEEPIRIGFVGALTGRGADIGESSRNAVQLAVEEWNAEGGLRGRPIELVVRDDRTSAEGGAQAARELADARVAVAIGPNISAVATGIVPVINERQLLTISPTVSSLAFAGSDDMFLRINWTTRDNAQIYAERYVGTLARKRVAIAFDLNNEVFSRSWAEEFERAAAGMGGEVVSEAGLDGNLPTSFAEVAGRLLEHDPDAILMVANAVDVARLAQQIRKSNASVPLIAAEWAGSEQLIEMGGRAIEGLELVQAYDRESKTERYTRFRHAYLERFQREPGYASVAAYDAAIVALEGMKRQKDNESLKQAILGGPAFEGLQQPVEFDRFGDSKRKAFFVRVRDGRFARE
ncbi:MAG: ABC transporter substrate-binding protein [Rhodocyclaceae bacterium]|nr:ABC transporter substrate-binding protein [Rhodocyclaceae bacterium]